MSRCPAHHLNALLIALVCACNPGCGGRDDTGPPKLHLGSDVCDFCKMIISDQNFAAACVVRSTDGRVRSAAFDDIGCLLEYQRTLADDAIERRYVTDYDSGAWLDATEVFYIQSPDVRSPMASGLIASQTQAGADRLAQRFNGSTHRYEQLGGYLNPDDLENRHEETTASRSQPIDTAPLGGDEATLEIPE